MSKQIAEFTNHGNRRYPWEEWLNGSIWSITRGEDFATSPTSMRTMIYTRAAHAGLTAEVHMIDENTLEFTTRPR